MSENLPALMTSSGAPALVAGNGTNLGMPLAGSDQENKFKVCLVQIGVKPKTYKVPPGATVEDLLEVAKVKLDRHTITVDDEVCNSSKVLQPNNFVYVIPVPKNG
jgi:hypothetical protein